MIIQNKNKPLKKRKESVKNAIRQFNTCAPILIALIDTARQNILIDLASAEDEEMNVSDLTELSHLSRPAVSHHLKVLKDVGLVQSRKQGTQMLYSLKFGQFDDQFDGLITALETLIDYSKRKRNIAGIAEQELI